MSTTYRSAQLMSNDIQTINDPKEDNILIHVIAFFIFMYLTNNIILSLILVCILHYIWFNK